MALRSWMMLGLAVAIAYASAVPLQLSVPSTAEGAYGSVWLRVDEAGVAADQSKRVEGSHFPTLPTQLQLQIIACHPGHVQFATYQQKDGDSLKAQLEIHGSCSQAGTVIQERIWYHVAVDLQPSASEQQQSSSSLYVDGQLVEFRKPSERGNPAGNCTDSQAGYNPGTVQLAFGHKAVPNAATKHANGLQVIDLQIASAAIYSGQLTQGIASQLYSSGICATVPLARSSVNNHCVQQIHGIHTQHSQNLLGLWLISSFVQTDADTETSVPDLSGASNHARLHPATSGIASYTANSPSPECIIIAIDSACISQVSSAISTKRGAVMDTLTAWLPALLRAPQSRDVSTAVSRPAMRALSELDSSTVSNTTLLGVIIGLVVAACLSFFLGYQIWRLRASRDKYRSKCEAQAQALAAPKAIANAQSATSQELAHQMNVAQFQRMQAQMPALQHQHSMQYSPSQLMYRPSNMTAQELMMMQHQQQARGQSLMSMQYHQQDGGMDGSTTYSGSPTRNGNNMLVNMQQASMQMRGYDQVMQNMMTGYSKMDASSDPLAPLPEQTQIAMSAPLQTLHQPQQHQQQQQVGYMLSQADLSAAFDNRMPERLTNLEAVLPTLPHPPDAMMSHQQQEKLQQLMLMQQQHYANLAQQQRRGTGTGSEVSNGVVSGNAAASGNAATMAASYDISGLQSDHTNSAASNPPASVTLPLPPGHTETMGSPARVPWSNNGQDPRVTYEGGIVQGYDTSTQPGRKKSENGVAMGNRNINNLEVNTPFALPAVLSTIAETESPHRPHFQKSSRQGNVDTPYDPERPTPSDGDRNSAGPAKQTDLEIRVSADSGSREEARDVNRQRSQAFGGSSLMNSTMVDLMMVAANESARTPPRKRISGALNAIGKTLGAVFGRQSSSLNATVSQPAGDSGDLNASCPSVTVSDAVARDGTARGSTVMVSQQNTMPVMGNSAGSPKTITNQLTCEVPNMQSKPSEQQAGGNGMVASVNNDVQLLSQGVRWNNKLPPGVASAFEMAGPGSSASESAQPGSGSSPDTGRSGMPNNRSIFSPSNLSNPYLMNGSPPTHTWSQGVSVSNDEGPMHENNLPVWQDNNHAVVMKDALLQMSIGAEQSSNSSSNTATYGLAQTMSLAQAQSTSIGIDKTSSLARTMMWPPAPSSQGSDQSSARQAPGNRDVQSEAYSQGSNGITGSSAGVAAQQRAVAPTAQMQAQYQNMPGRRNVSSTMLPTVQPWAPVATSQARASFSGSPRTGGTIPQMTNAMFVHPGGPFMHQASALLTSPLSSNSSTERGSGCSSPPPHHQSQQQHSAPALNISSQAGPASQPQVSVPVAGMPRSPIMRPNRVLSLSQPVYPGMGPELVSPRPASKLSRLGSRLSVGSTRTTDLPGSPRHPDAATPTGPGSHSAIIAVIAEDSTKQQETMDGIPRATSPRVASCQSENLTQLARAVSAQAEVHVQEELSRSQPRSSGVHWAPQMVTSLRSRSVSQAGEAPLASPSLSNASSHHDPLMIQTRLSSSVEPRDTDEKAPWVAGQYVGTPLSLMVPGGNANAATWDNPLHVSPVQSDIVSPAQLITQANPSAYSAVGSGSGLGNNGYKAMQASGMSKYSDKYPVMRSASALDPRLPSQAAELATAHNGGTWKATQADLPAGVLPTLSVSSNENNGLSPRDSSTQPSQDTSNVTSLSGVSQDRSSANKQLDMVPQINTRPVQQGAKALVASSPERSEDNCVTPAAATLSDQVGAPRWGAAESPFNPGMNLSDSDDDDVNQPCRVSPGTQRMLDAALPTLAPAGEGQIANLACVARVSSTTLQALEDALQRGNATAPGAMPLGYAGPTPAFPLEPLNPRQGLPPNLVPAQELARLPYNHPDRSLSSKFGFHGATGSDGGLLQSPDLARARALGSFGTGSSNNGSDSPPPAYRGSFGNLDASHRNSFLQRAGTTLDRSSRGLSRQDTFMETISQHQNQGGLRNGVPRHTMSGIPVHPQSITPQHPFNAPFGNGAGGMGSPQLQHSQRNMLPPTNARFQRKRRITVTGASTVRASSAALPHNYNPMVNSLAGLSNFQQAGLVTGPHLSMQRNMDPTVFPQQPLHDPAFAALRNAVFTGGNSASSNSTHRSSMDNPTPFMVPANLQGTYPGVQTGNLPTEWDPAILHMQSTASPTNSSVHSSRRYRDARGEPFRRTVSTSLLKPVDSVDSVHQQHLLDGGIAMQPPSLAAQYNMQRSMMTGAASPFQQQQQLPLPHVSCSGTMRSPQEPMSNSNLAYMQAGQPGWNQMPMNVSEMLIHEHNEVSYPEPYSESYPEPYMDSMVVQQVEDEHQDTKAGVVTDHDPVLPHVTLDIDLSEITFDNCEPLGKGAFGVVYKGFYHGQAVAVKMAGSRGHGKSSNEALETLVTEARFLSRINSRHIVRFLGASFRDPVFIVEELLVSDLQKLIHNMEKLIPLDEVLRIGEEIARGLDLIHPTIVHRDLKPANILIDQIGTAKISDFGMARFKLHSLQSTKNTDAGTMNYMAPECFQQAKIDCKADVFSWAVIMCEMLTGMEPWAGLNHALLIGKVVSQERPDLPESEARCPKELRDLIVDCWDADPKRRPAAKEIWGILSMMRKNRAIARQELEEELALANGQQQQLDQQQQQQQQQLAGNMQLQGDMTSPVLRKMIARSASRLN